MRLVKNHIQVLLCYSFNDVAKMNFAITLDKRKLHKCQGMIDTCWYQDNVAWM